jgi:L-ascorbate metabolism protein UlaG (beta-lactamase superfamily)
LLLIACVKEGVVMEITYLGHSSFKLKGKAGTVVTDPYSEKIGFALPNVSADIVTMSHSHPDHNASNKISGTARREKPFVVSYPGEYEVGGISVFGTSTFHDDKKGAERGENTVFTIFMDDLRVCHLGDLGHELTTEQLGEIGDIDVLLIPVGGHYTIDPKTAVKIIHQLEPFYVIPMHYKTEKHSAEMFGEVKTLADFLKEYGLSPSPVAKLNVEKNKLPEETELVVLEAQA